MKKLALLVLLFSTVAASAASKLKPSDYTIVVHVAATHIDMRTGELVLETTINGKNYELTREGSHLIPLGNYKAYLSDQSSASNGILLVYEILLPDGKAQNFTVTGESE